MKKTIYNFKGKCSHCKSDIETEDGKFNGNVESIIPIGFYTICSRCGWKTPINAVEGNRFNDEKEKVR